MVTSPKKILLTYIAAIYVMDIYGGSMDIQSVLLGFLMHKSMTGYDLKKAFSISFSFFSGLSYGSIYPALKKMENRGLISKKTEIQDGAPNRKVYSVTEAGKEVFLKSLRSPLVFEQPKSAFLMKLFFFAHLSPEERETIALDYLNSIEQLHKQLEAVQPEIQARADRFQYLCFQFGFRVFQDLARNVSRTIHELEEGGNENVG
jgi:DNA-binding PadR family transcriptional regulator